MSSSVTVSTRAKSSWIQIQLLAFLLLLGTAFGARAEDCSQYPGGVLDGAQGVAAPSQLYIDRNCTIKNYSNFDTNISFSTQPGQTDERWLVIFDNAIHTGQMACNVVAGHKIWFVNGSESQKLFQNPNCQSQLIPVEKIDKRSPASYATIGVPFTYRLTIPVLFDPATGTVVPVVGSNNDLHTVVITDDLNATGVDLTVVGTPTVTWLGGGTAVPHTYSNVGNVLTFAIDPSNSGVQIPAGQQLAIDITVILNDSPANTLGKSFSNTANWSFGRAIDLDDNGVIDYPEEYFAPLPGERGISAPMVIAAPNLVMTKSGPATMNLGVSADFTLDVLNNGTSEAWDLALLDRLPDGATGGMCDQVPQILSVTRAGNPLTQGTHYSLNYAVAPTCELTLTLLDAAGALAPGEHLIVTYRTRLDTNSQDGVTLTNISGVAQWFNGSSGNASRQSYARVLSDGTPGTLDYQDAHSVAVALAGYFFEKTVVNLRSGENPAITAAAGDTLRYTLRLQTTTAALNGFTIHDELDALNSLAGFAPGTLTLVSALPAGAVNNSNPMGGAKGTGVINISNLNLAAGSQLLIQFDIAISGSVAEGVVVANQSQVLSGGAIVAVSDDPYVNGQANPLVAGDEDSTRVLIRRPTLLFQKTVLTSATATPGDVVRYRLEVRNQSDIPLTNFSLVDELDSLNNPAMFVAGTLTLASTLPAGATNNSNPNGGTKSTGLVDIRNLSVGVAGAVNDRVTLEFTVRLAPVIANGTVVLNQGHIAVGGSIWQRSDDPGVSGSEDPTRLAIQSAPSFRVQKFSLDMSGDPDVLLRGERLRYTITVQNIGTANATGADLRDLVPANTTYVAGSTTLNGVPVADNAGAAPLENGILINAPENTTPGFMRADAANTTVNIATLTFDVTINTDVPDGTIIANQGFVSAPAGGILDYPSDDPRTPVLNDPTRNIVGRLPLLFAEKKVALQTDLGSPGIVDPGDVLRYTITIYNTGLVLATGVTLRDLVPPNTTYVANSTRLNGVAVGQPDGGISPLVGGANVSSTDRVSTLPGPGQGTLSAGGVATIQFDLRVNAGVPGGTLISNQATVATTELSSQLTDGDGNPSNGAEPTVVVVGFGQQLSITKQVAVVGGGPAIAGAQLEYLVSVTNISSVPALYVLITDNLDDPQPGRLTYVAQSATLNGSTNGISITGATISANYSGTYGPLQPGASTTLRFRARINPTLPIGTRVTNTGTVTWNSPTQTARASVSIDVGGIVGVGTLSGTAWHDANFNNLLDSNERLLQGWTVELYRNSTLVFSGMTGANGAYQISGVAPNYITGERYELRFRAPGAGTSTAKLGMAYSQFTNGLQQITDIIVAPGSVVMNLDLPIDPNGVVYNAIARTPVSGAMLSMQTGSGVPLPTSCFDDPAQQNQVTLADGYYKFDLNFSDPACTSGGDYLIAVTAPSSAYIAGYSQIIPPMSGPLSAAFNVPTCPGVTSDALISTAQYCEATTSEFAPGVAVPARTARTNYHVHLRLDGGLRPGTSQLFNNHLPLDPVLNAALAITKTTPMLNVTRGQLVPYTITVRNLVDFTLTDISIADRFPAGFRYVPGSARLDKTPVEPTLVGSQLIWNNITIAPSAQRSLVVLLAVGAGVSEGEFVNRVRAVQGFTGNALSGEASATVRLVPDPTFDCTDVIGKAFDDANRNGHQDDGEPGLSGVRIVSARGLAATTDQYGRFHITCAITPNEDRGSNYILKLDERTLPSGYRPSTRPVLVERATRGKVLRFDFGASIHRVVSLDIADAVFEPGTTEMRPQWKPRIKMLLDELQKSPATLRLSYLADIEDKSLVDRRMEVIRKEISQAWTDLNCCYRLTIEPEVFWRLGAPPDQSITRTQSGR